MAMVVAFVVPYSVASSSVAHRISSVGCDVARFEGGHRGEKVTELPGQHWANRDAQRHAFADAGIGV
jgi:hypothetical protein